MVIVLGTAWPVMVCHAWAASATRRAAWYDLIFKIGLLTALKFFNLTGPPNIISQNLNSYTLHTSSLSLSLPCPLGRFPTGLRRRQCHSCERRWSPPCSLARFCAQARRWSAGGRSRRRPTSAATSAGMATAGGRIGGSRCGNQGQ